MKIKKLVKNIFFTYTFIIMICLYAITFIDYTKTSPKELASSLKNSVNTYETMKYRIISDDKITCTAEQEYFYEDDNYYYYFICPRSSSTYIEWQNGEIHSLLDALHTGKVTIDSLLENGLVAYKAEKNYEN